jgi:hypothetical protein
MKRHLKIAWIVLSALCLVPGWLAAQETPLLINTEARLETVLQLNITEDSYVEFGVKKINEDLYQITKQPDDVMFSVESTGNWNLAISADDPYFRGVNDSTLKIPVDFIGLYIENRGGNWDNGLFSNIANVTKDTVIYLNPDKTMLLASGLRGNVGGADQNSFILRWKFFYEDEGLRIAKFSDFDIADDNYQVGFTITLSESTPYGQMEK